MKTTQARRLSTKRLVFLAVLIAAQLIVGRFSFGNNFIKFSAGFLLSALIGYWYGPWYAGIAGGIIDLLSATLFPMGAFNPGFTVIAIFNGFVYGGLLDQRKMPTVSWWRVGVTSLILNLVSNLLFNTFLLHLMYKTPFWPLFYTRLPKELIMVPLYIVGIYFFLRAVEHAKLTQRLWQ